jgi:tRNA (guanine-N1)-methyltransferase
VRIDIITIFPEYFTPLSMSLLGKAAARGTIQLQIHDLRRWAHDVHRTVDDAPFGGGPGMVMAPQPWGEALDEVTGSDPGQPRLVVPTPAGLPFSQAAAAGLGRSAWLIFACGRYEGIDARVIADARERMPVDELSIGDYVLSGGEPAVLVMVDAITRLVPGVLGNAGSAPGRWPACWKGRPTPGPGCGAATRSRPSCCPVTMPPSPAGGVMKRCAGPLRCARIWSPGWTLRRWTAGTGRCSWTLAFRSAPKIWHTDSPPPT